jgi:phage shock protein C
MNKKLYKSNSDKKIDGVCAGIAEYFNLDPTVVRIAWIIFSCLGGSGLLAYLICAIVMPRKPDYVEVD